MQPRDQIQSMITMKLPMQEKQFSNLDLREKETRNKIEIPWDRYPKLPQEQYFIITLQKNKSF